MIQIENNKRLAASFAGLKYCGENYNYTTQSATSYLIFQVTEMISMVNNLPSIVILIDWNKFKTDFPDVNQNELSHFKLKILQEAKILDVSFSSFVHLRFCVVEPCWLVSI